MIFLWPIIYENTILAQTNLRCKLYMKGGGKLTFTGGHLALHTTTSAGVKSSSFVMCIKIADDEWDNEYCGALGGM